MKNSSYYRMWMNLLRHAAVANELRHVAEMPAMMRRMMVGRIDCRLQMKKLFVEVPEVREMKHQQGIVRKQRKGMEVGAKPVEWRELNTY
jgi:hypothetical protein